MCLVLVPKLPLSFSLISSQKPRKKEKMMHMTFYWGKTVTLLFNFWKTDTWTDYSLTLLACFLFSSFYQYMEDRRIRFRRLSSAADPATPLLYPKTSYAKNPAKYAGAVLFGVNSAIGYLLMLAIMSFNGGVFVAIVSGLSVGYLVFRSNDNEDVLVVVDNPCACA